MTARRERPSPLPILAVLLFGLICLLALLFGIHETRNAAFNHFTSDGKVEALIQDLRAPGDPSTVATSSMGLAFQIRGEVTEDVSKGMTRPDILQAMVDEYGPDVLAVPRFEGFGVLTWIAPLVVFFGVLAIVIVYLMKSVKQISFGTTENPAEDNSDSVSGIQTQLKDYL